MIVFDVATKVLDTEIFPQHTIADLNLWHYIHCFVQSEKVFTMKENKHTHARTHTHTHTHSSSSSIFNIGIVHLQFDL